MIVTSIIPSDAGGRSTAKRLMHLNNTLETVSQQEGATFVNLHELYTKKGDGLSINEGLFINEDGVHMHLNTMGNTVLASILNTSLCGVNDRARIGIMDMITKTVNNKLKKR